jgi:asparagine synthase (glutamine-hydrolysing)
MGFPYPYERFYQSYRDVIDTILATARNPYVDLSQPDRLRENWRALSFLLWYELFINENHELFTRIESMVGAREAAHEPSYAPEFRRNTKLPLSVAT